MASDPEKKALMAQGPPPEAGPFVLRTLLDDVPLSADGASDDVKINCVDYLDHNLYVGTSASELLHFVQIPPDPSDKSSGPVFILASRLRPAFTEGAGSGSPRPGVQQILLLPRVGKACVLCNWTVTFYSLPELSPVFDNVKVKNCNWIGGVDLNDVGPEHTGMEGQAPSGVTILLSLNRKIQVVRVGESARAIKQIDFAGSTISLRRDSIACVADSRSYALLDIDRQLKIPLMSISSLDDSQPGGAVGQVQNIAGSSDGGLLRSTSSAQTRPASLAASEAQGHARSTSLGGLLAAGAQAAEKKLGDGEGESDSLQATPNSAARRDRSTSPHPVAADKPLPPPPDASAGQSSTAVPPAKPGPVFLKPHIASPTPEEFLLVTGTGPLDPGIGMFVNLDGDPTRPTLEFERYPKEIVVDGGAADLSSSRPALAEEEEGYVLASMSKEFEDGILHHGLEVQRWDVNSGEDEAPKFWLETPAIASDESTDSKNRPSLGIRSLVGSEEGLMLEVIERLCQKKFSPSPSGTPDASGTPVGSKDSRTAQSIERLSKERELFERDSDSQDEDSPPEGWEATRNTEEEEFASRLAKTTDRLAVWSGSHIWWVRRNPLLLQLEARIESTPLADPTRAYTSDERRQLFAILNSIRGRDAKTELEFLTFSYIRQRASVLLFTSFLHSADSPFSDPELKALEEVLLDGGLDPRVVLCLVPELRNEIVVGRRGIWIYGGVKGSVEKYIASEPSNSAGQTISALEPRILQFIKRFLTAWRRKKGFGSIADEKQVFRTVDAALLAVLLELDKGSPRGLARSGSIRSELYDLVDRGVDCFDRAVNLLESYHRLFVLSRLYQSRKMAADVLGTWKRIIEGEQDDGDEFRDGEQRVRDYLNKISNQALVREYGIWLATRNPKLGVQVFADDKGRAPRFEPTQVVAMLRQEAPDAVKYYLEHLVFGKGQTIYVKELINYYLDVVIDDLQSSPASREAITAGYETYRALRAPKPTYRQFLTDNAPPDNEVWQSRLRLLQLLGGAYEYDSKAIRERIASVTAGGAADGGADEQQLLVPEAIILDGRERRHEEALRLLVHRLGDYDTAVSYCLRGGASIYTPTPGRRESMPGREAQARLFGALLREFLALADVSARVEQTGALLERFGGWLDVQEVLGLIPDGWSVDVAAGFLLGALRRLVEERRETAVARALSSAENLRVNYELVVMVEEKGPTVEAQH
ncbi:Transforming growth factor-beta receptor-associated protein 1 [Pleurostoma richardsiae]|uniref:Transforming growth factor-beta receptor-associated protein 1 n=1 Tax=Pleurostoma richardsiae TaxID=41990 RepID=A0AA38RUM8_9PEZI|nr:Transforming growth factor-beta receptor-associated protein 1 [Pleurostoma richardsiae]